MVIVPVLFVDFPLFSFTNRWSGLPWQLFIFLFICTRALCCFKSYSFFNRHTSHRFILIFRAHRYLLCSLVKGWLSPFYLSQQGRVLVFLLGKDCYLFLSRLFKPRLALCAIRDIDPSSFMLITFSTSTQF